MHFLTELGAKKVEASLIYLHVPFYSITTCLPGAQVSCLLKLIIDTAFILNMTNSFNQMAVQIALFYFFSVFVSWVSCLYLLWDFITICPFFIPFNYLDLVHNIFLLNDSTKQLNNQIVTIHGHFHILISFFTIYLKVILVPYSTLRNSRDILRKHKRFVHSLSKILMRLSSPSITLLILDMQFSSSVGKSK